jgi:hypothetical protein
MKSGGLAVECSTTAGRQTKTSSHPHRFCRIATICVALTLCATSRANVVLDNLVGLDPRTGSGGNQMGAAIQIGDTPIVLTAVEFHQFFIGGYYFTPGETFAVYSRNADGTLGSVLFSDFSVIPDGDSRVTKASATSTFVLQANTIYWLVLTAPPEDEQVVLWNYTKDMTYYAELGVSIPAENASYYTFEGGSFYLPLSSGPQELRVTGTAFVPAAPMASGAVSRIAHGTAGAYDIPLPLSGATGVECRSGGPTGIYQLVVFFPEQVTFQSAAVTAGIGSVKSAMTAHRVTEGTGTDVTINLTGVANAQRLTVTLFGVNNGSVNGNVAVTFGVLLGDTTGNGAVNASDIGAVKSQSGQPINASNFRNDVTANGSITASDVGQVKSVSGSALPAAR